MNVAAGVIRGVEAELVRLQRESERLHHLLARVALGINTSMDGLGYCARHTLQVVQELFETVDPDIFKQEEAAATDDQEA